MPAGTLATLPGTALHDQHELIVDRSSSSHRILRLGLALIAVVLLAGVSSNAASAKTKSCADQVIADWYDDGRVDKIYPLECYRAAIAKLPPDIVDYSNAKEEIGRALAFAKQGKPDPGGADPTPPSTSTPTDTSSTDTSSTGKGSTGKGSTGKSSTDTTPTGTADTTTNDAVTQTTDTSGPSSVPIPLLVLGGLAVLLLAAGSAGYLRRRMGGNGDGDGTPPASA